MNQVHSFSAGGRMMALDVASGAVHELDKAGFAVLEWLGEADKLPEQCPPELTQALADEFTADELAECYGELYALYQSGLLYSEDTYETLSARAFAPDAPVKAMCLHIAHDCNLRCEYCFAAKGDFGTGRKLMSLETAKRAIDFLVERSAGRRNLEVDFFGGEPLMNLAVVRETVAHARTLEERKGKRFRFTLTTNGLLLNDEAIDFINAEMDNVVLSVDGRPEINDALRKTPGGQGSYEVIVPKYQRLVERRAATGKDYYVRGTFTRLNPDFTEDILHLYRQGFDQISVEPVVSDGALPFALTEEDLPRVFEEYDRLTQALAELRADKQARYLNFFHFMVDLSGGPCAIKRLKGCGCGCEYVAVTPEGDLYPCHQFVGMDRWKMGTLYGPEAGQLSGELRERFAEAHLYAKRGCRDCWCRYFCSGGCNANNVQYEGDLLTPHALGCALEKKRVECALGLAAMTAE